MKTGTAKTFVVVDAAMNDLIRPTLYDAHHDIRPVRPAAGRRRRASSPTSSAGSARPATISPSTATCRRCRAGDLVAVMTVGAYGAVQASTYNTRPLLPEILVKGDEWAVVRPRQTYDELIGMDALPPWLAAEVIRAGAVWPRFCCTLCYFSPSGAERRNADGAIRRR